MGSASSWLRAATIVAMLPLAAIPARADVTLDAAALALPGVSLRDVHVRIADAADGALALTLGAAQADLPALGWKRVGLALDGNLVRDSQLRWVLTGALRASGAPGAALAHADLRGVWDDAADNLEIDLAQGPAGASVAMPLDDAHHLQINLHHVPATWLQGLLAQASPGARMGGGLLDADLALDIAADATRIGGRLALAGLGLDSHAGAIAARQLDGEARIGLTLAADAARLQLDGVLQGGELLLGKLDARLPPHAVSLALQGSFGRGGTTLERLHVGDPDVLQLDGALAVDARGDLRQLRLERFDARFPAAYQRYGQGLLAAMGLPPLRVAGRLDGTLDIDDGLPRRFAFRSGALDVADAQGRFALHGLDGALDWSECGERPATAFGWRALDFHRIALGGALMHWQSRNGTLALRAPADVPLLGGSLQLSALDWRPAATAGQRLGLSLALTGVDMAQLSRALDWPAFSGTLAGAVPALRWIGDRIELAGGLSMHVFDGFIDVTRLAIEHPFGVAPLLTGDVTLSQLDLGALTGVFDIGGITGRLDGSVRGLQLANWSPVAFDASLRADGGGTISQRAVGNLAAVGGGSFGGGLQGHVLKLFRHFGYRRIGLNGVLGSEVCQMSGLEDDGDGYVILEGSGLPHLQIVGHQRRVDWPTLLRRLKAAADGAPPEIR